MRFPTFQDVPTNYTSLTQDRQYDFKLEYFFLNDLCQSWNGYLLFLSGGDLSQKKLELVFNTCTSILGWINIISLRKKCHRWYIYFYGEKISKRAPFKINPNTKCYSQICQLRFLCKFFNYHIHIKASASLNDL